MTVLLELFDPSEPINNILSLAVLKPDLLIVMGDTRIRKQKNQKPLSGFISSKKLKTRLEFRSCRTYDTNDIYEQLREIILAYGAENCVIDALGGGDTFLLAAGSCCREFPDLRVITHKARTNELIWLYGSSAQNAGTLDLSISVDELISLSGGQLIRNGHVSKQAIDEDLLQMIPSVFEVYMRCRKRWPAFVRYLQQLNQPEYIIPGCGLSGPKHFGSDKWKASIDLEVVMALQETGVIRDFRMDSSTCTIYFQSNALKNYLCDVGIWLEMYTYKVLRSSGLFHSVEISVVVSWDNDEDNNDIINEIDVVATDGLAQLFISCKTSIPDNSVLNEIHMLTARFGTKYAFPVLATTCHLETEAPGVYRRALEMGICVIDADDLAEEDFIDRLHSLRRKWNMC